MRGTIGIIGPKRMDYDKVIGTLKTITHQLDDLYKKKDNMECFIGMLWDITERDETNGNRY